MDKGELDKMLDYAASKYDDIKPDVNNSSIADRYHKDLNRKTDERRSFHHDLLDFD